MSFIKKHPILVNLGLIIVAFLVVCYVATLCLNVFTEHGKTVAVPDVRNMSVAEAKSVLRNSGFNCEVTDSLYNEQYSLGAVVEQSPKAKAEVKSNRTVYIIVNYSTPRTITLPNLTDYSERQGLSMLQGLGFSNVKLMPVSSPYKGLVLGVLVDGRQVEPGTKVLPSVSIILQVGDGGGSVIGDTVAEDFIDPYVSDDMDEFFE